MQESELNKMLELEVRARLSEFTERDLVILVTRCNREYWDDHNPTLSDPLYDQLVNRLKRLNPNAPILNAMGPSAPAGASLAIEEALKLKPAERFGTTVRHQRAMLSLDKCYAEPELLAWAKKFKGEIVIMPKMDGIACSIRYDTRGRLVLAATRGSGSEGEDITANVMNIPEVPSKIKMLGKTEVEVRGEVYMRLSAFAKYKGEYSNPRNLTAGTVKLKDRKKSRAKELSFYPYDIIGPTFGDEREKFSYLEDVGFKPEKYTFVRERKKLQAAYEDYAKARVNNLDFEIDGVVYRASSVSEQIRMGETGHHPRYAIAYKFQGDSGVTDLKDIEWSVSRTGIITPVALLEPIELSGAMIGRASLHNLNIYEGLGLTIGCKVEVTRRGGVIPNVERVTEAGKGKKPFALPTTCPACGSKVLRRKKRDGEFLQCSTPDQCVQARLGELEHFAKVVDLQGFGPKVLSQCVDAGLLKSPADFYRLKAADLESLERMGKKSAKKLIDQVEQHKEIELWVFLQSLGIDHLGKQNGQMLAEQFHDLAKIRKLTRDDLIAVKGIKDAIADALVDGLKRRSELIDELLTFIKVKAAAAPQKVVGGKLEGKSFVFTGTLEGFSRSEAQARVKTLGGEAPSGVSKNLTYLVVGAGKGAKSSKQKKAEKLRDGGASLEIISEDEFLKLIGGMG